MPSTGIHHITAIAGDPQQNLDFYSEVLGLRLVKRTVNFDDPGSYHFYFGDNIGSPGTIVTFFSWPGARRGIRGNGQVTAVGFAVPRKSIPFWKDRLRQNQVKVEDITEHFGSNALRFLDPDGLLLELVESPVIPSDAEGSARHSFKATSTASVDHARHDGATGERITGFAAPTLAVSRPERTEILLTEFLGFEFVAEENHRRRFRGSAGNRASEIDVVSSRGDFGQIAVGTVHHIAFRAADDEEQLRFREQLVSRGLNVTPVIDRQYFHSIYFREPNGILFEIATDGPGFLIDESVEELGETLKLPPMYELSRAEIERVLPVIHLHHSIA